MGRVRYLDWLDEAADDYEAARLLYVADKYSKACFFSHQACEKAVKAPMIRRLGRYDPVHSVAELLRRLRPAVSVPEDLVRKGGSSTGTMCQLGTPTLGQPERPTGTT